MAEYGVNVGRFKRDFPGIVLVAGPYGKGYSAQRRDRRWRGTGPKVTALTLDELGRLLRRERAS